MVRQMSDKEILRGQVMAQLQEGKLSQQEVASRLSISVRQVKRLKRNYEQHGIAGLVSKKRGQASNRCIPASVLASALSLIGKHYADFGPTFATEKLREQHGIKLSVETVRGQMIRAGYWKAKRGQTIRAHPMRERRARRGELIQIDGSPHDWFEGRSESCCLLVFIDDATGELMELEFVNTETTLGYMAVLRRHIQHHGLPAAIYSDRHSIFRINAKEADNAAQTQFARALSQLGIEGIQAYSPQAKGRVERANQTLQDRLVKEMRLAGINDQAAANTWLPIFIADFNQRFAVKPAVLPEAHVVYKGRADTLNSILSHQEERTLSKNLSCQYEGELLQVKTQGQGLALRGSKVHIHRHTDGHLELRWRGRKLAFDRLSKPAKQQAPADGKDVNQRVDKALKARQGHLPAANHPWKKTSKECVGGQLLVKAQFQHPKESLCTTGGHAWDHEKQSV